MRSELDAMETAELAHLIDQWRDRVIVETTISHLEYLRDQRRPGAVRAHHRENYGGVATDLVLNLQIAVSVSGCFKRLQRLSTCSGASCATQWPTPSNVHWLAAGIRATALAAISL